MIHSEYHVVLFDFPNTSLLGVFSSQGWESLCEKPSRCPSMFIQVFYSNIHVIDTSILQFTTVFRGTRTVVTLELIFDVLHVPRVACSGYPSALYLHSISQDEFASCFCEQPILWGDTLNFTTYDFAKGPRILNMVMTFFVSLSLSFGGSLYRLPFTYDSINGRFLLRHNYM